MNDLTYATKPLTVTVHEEDRDAVLCSPTSCVVANALRRQPGVLDVRVGQTKVRILRKRGWVGYQLDRNTIAAIRAWDQKKSVLPAGFTAHLLPQVQRVRTPASARGAQTSTGALQSINTRQPSTRNIAKEPVKKGRAKA